MDDWSGFSQAMRERSQERRAGNRESSAELLRERGIAFEEKNHGAHLIVRHGGKVADLWPGTGKYRVRGVEQYRRGVFGLLRDLGIECDKSQ